MSNKFYYLAAFGIVTVVLLVFGWMYVIPVLAGLWFAGYSRLRRERAAKVFYRVVITSMIEPETVIDRINAGGNVSNTTVLLDFHVEHSNLGEVQRILNHMEHTKDWKKLLKHSEILDE